MDLGIKGRRALVCASSKGLGRGCAEALAAEGVDLVLNARGSEALEATAATIRQAYGVEVTAVAADITSEAGQADVLTAAGAVEQPIAHLPMLLSIESQSTPSGQLLPSAPRQPVWQEPSPLQTQPLCGSPQSESTLHEQYENVSMMLRGVHHACWNSSNLV